MYHDVLRTGAVVPLEAEGLLEEGQINRHNLYIFGGQMFISLV